jgi:spermidine synthase
MTVASNLFTTEFFRIAKSRLRPDGVFAQWIQTYSLAPEHLRSILAAVHGSFANVAVFETLNGVDLLVIGSDAPIRLSRAEIERRMSEFRVRLDLSRVDMRTAEDILAMIQASPEDVRTIASGATVNTDDNGLVEFAAPRALYLDTQDANMAMLQRHAGVSDPGLPDGFRASILNRWIRRQQGARARMAAAYFLDSELSRAFERPSPPR